MKTIEDLYIKDNVDFTQKYTSGFEFVDENAGVIDLSKLDIEVDVHNIDQYPNEQYALLRKDGLGTSDSSIILGVNPYTTKSQLIAEKCRNYLTDEEKAVGDKSAVRKGRELEPLIIHKASQIMDNRVIKPIHMYRHKDYPYIKFNFDGVADKVYNEDGTYQYIPVEIKVVTIYGEKHYNKRKAFFTERTGYRMLPEHYEKENWSIEQKATAYGIPPYYYTQLQQQIFGLNAPFGYLTVLMESLWEVHSYFVWRDQKVINQLIIEDTKTWNTITAKRENDFTLGVEILDSSGNKTGEIR